MKGLFLSLMITSSMLWATYDFEFTVLKYGGGGDWYEGLVGVKELMKFLASSSGLNPKPNPVTIELEDSHLENHPFLYLTGHGVIKFTPRQRTYLKRYLLNGGFLYANDDYGLDKHFRKEMEALFPQKKWVILPNSHPLFNIFFSFPNGTPKIHEHDNKPPTTLALYHNDRIIILYTYEADIGDGWAPYQVHKNPPEVRKKALEFGVNIILYHLNH